MILPDPIFVVGLSECIASQLLVETEEEREVQLSKCREADRA